MQPQPPNANSVPIIGAQKYDVTFVYGPHNLRHTLRDVDEGGKAYLIQTAAGVGNMIQWDAEDGKEVLLRTNAITCIEVSKV